ncbi:MAG: hypothetical protein JWO56_2166 [Acidobacteria bacterium]|nr:hypothetical protein [Acidobacteriota bacterium]
MTTRACFVEDRQSCLFVNPEMDFALRRGSAGPLSPDSRGEG